MKCEIFKERKEMLFQLTRFFSAIRSVFGGKTKNIFCKECIDRMKNNEIIGY